MKNRSVRVAFLVLCVSVALIEVQSDDFPVLTGSYLGQEPPGDTAVVFAPGIVSTGKEHSAAMFTPDGREVWFGRLYPAAIYYMKVIGGVWSEPRIAHFCDTFTTSLYPVLSHDGNRIFFSSDRPPAEQARRLPRGDYHIWMVERKEGEWSGPEHLDERLNFGRRQSAGSTAANRDLYFASFGDKGSMDLFIAKVEDGTYGNPVELGELNSPSPDHSPFVAPDESYLIFSTFRGGHGRSDLFISFRDQNGTWSQPRNMGPTVNSPYKEEYPWVSPDGKYLFFNSNRPSILNQKPIADGPGNIYWVDARIISRLKPEAPH